MTSLTAFHLFAHLPLDLRNEIWAHTLPEPRLINVVPLNQPMPLPLEDASRFGLARNASFPRNGPSCATQSTDEEQYSANPCSYGAQHPVALSVCRESRQEALRHLTLRFNAYWNLKTDYLFVELPREKDADFAMRWVADMRVRGLLHGFRNLALRWNVWDTKGEEHCMKTLRLLPNIKNCTFVFRNPPMDGIDRIDTDDIWRLVPVTHWANGRYEAFVKVNKYLAVDKVANAKEWADRQSVPEIGWNEIWDRRFGEKTRGTTGWSNWRSLEKPGEDWFG